MLWSWSVVLYLMSRTWRPLISSNTLNCNNWYMLSVMTCCNWYNLALLLWGRVIAWTSVASSEVSIDHHLVLAWVNHLWSATHWSVGFRIQTVATHWSIHPCQICCWIISLTIYCLLSWVVEDCNLVLSHRTIWSFNILMMINTYKVLGHLVRLGNFYYHLDLLRLTQDYCEVQLIPLSL